jgi:hypothetical protein
MRNKKIGFSILIFNCLVNLLIAQNLKTLRGSVHDTLGNPVPYVTLITVASENSRILTFGNTNIEGKFQIEVPEIKIFLLKVSGLGYEPKTLWIEYEDTNEDIEVILIPKNVVLNEAIITATSKVVEKGDTTTFKADAFRDSTERNLEQLLAKIPGIEINKNTGVISVQGKPIKKILIEGDDLTGRNYQLLSQNMAADIVDKIQIIDRFNENRLLKGLRKTDDKVINITLKGTRKSLLFGEITFGIGNDCRTNNNLNLLTIGKRIKAINFGSFNTVGLKSTATQILDTDFGEETEFQQQRTLLSTQNNRFIEINRLPSISLGTQSVQFNQSILGSSNFIVRPLEKLSVKGQITFSQDKMQFFTENQSQYILDSIFSLSQRDTTTNCPIVFEGRIDAQWDISSKSMLRIASQFQKIKLNTQVSTILNDRLISNELADRSASWQTSLDFTYRLSPNNALTINSLWVEHINTQNLNINQTFTRQLPLSVSTNSNKPFYHLSQGVEKPIRFIANSAQLFYLNQLFDFNILGGLVFKTENLKSDLQLDSLKSEDIFLNHLILEQKNFFIGFNLSKNLKQSRIFLNTSAGFHSQILNQFGNIDDKEKKGFYALPTLGYQWIKGKKSIFFTYGYNFSLPQFADITTGYIVTDYRNVTRGAAAFIPIGSHTFIANYKYGKFEDNFMSNFNAIVSFQNGGYGQDLTITPDFDVSSKIQNVSSTKSLRFSSGLEYYSSDLYLRFKMKPSLGISLYQNILNGSNIRLIQSMNSAIDFTVRSAYLKWFNFSLGGNIGFASTTTNVSREINSIKNQSIGSFLDFQLRLGKRISSRIDNEFFAFRQAQSQLQNYYFSNFSLDFTLPKPKLQLSFSIKNLFNSNYFVNNSINDYVISSNRIRLLPRYFLIDGTFKF